MSRFIDLDSPKIYKIGRDKFGNILYSIPPDTETVSCACCRLSQENSWIKLTDRNSFPKVGEDVIVTIKDESGDNVYYYTDVGWWVGIDNMFIVDNDRCYSVTHWRKMPEPCKE